MIESFYHAFHGIWIGLKEERNVRIHFCSMIAVIICGILSEGGRGRLDVFSHGHWAGSDHGISKYSP